MGTQNPRFFPLMGTVPSTKYCWAPGSCPSVKILSKSVGHGSLGDFDNPKVYSDTSITDGLVHLSIPQIWIEISSYVYCTVCTIPLNNN